MLCDHEVSVLKFVALYRAYKISWSGCFPKTLELYSYHRLYTVIHQIPTIIFLKKLRISQKKNRFYHISDRQMIYSVRCIAGKMRPLIMEKSLRKIRTTMRSFFFDMAKQY